MLKIKIFLTLTFLIFSLNTKGFAEGYGTTSMNFLKLGTSPEAQSLGEAYTANTGNVSGIFYNPANMATLKDYQFSFSYFQYFEDITDTFLGIATPQYKFGGFAYSLVYLKVNNIDGRDIYDRSTGILDAYSMMNTINYNKKFDKFSLGVNFKYLEENLVTDTANGTAYDVGVDYKLSNKISFGASVLNIGNPVKFRYESFDLPLMKRLGTVISLQNAKLYIDGIQDESQIKLATGLEYELMKTLSIRCGYKTGEDLANSLRLGFGLKIKNFSLNYAFVDYGDFGYTHLLGLTVNINGNKKVIAKDIIRQRYPEFWNLYKNTDK